MSIPKISIIIPIFNTEKYLKTCLNSVINQTLKEIEIICINDGSTDNSLKIIEEYASKDKRIRFISQKNNGVSYARNKGLEIATGEFIGFVDSDDYVSKNFFEKLYVAALKTNSDIACGEIVKIENNKKINLLKFNKIATSEKIKEKYKLCRIPRRCYVTNRIYKKDILLNLVDFKFQEGQNFEDLLWSHKIIAEMGKVVTVPNCIYYYNINANSITQKFTDKSKNDNSKSNLDCLKYLLKNKIKIKYSHYLPQKRIKIKIFNLTVLDIRQWLGIIFVYILGILILKIQSEKNW